MAALSGEHEDRPDRHPFLEFFAGGGMARLGLSGDWQCSFANEWDPKKAETYRRNFAPARELVVGDVAALKSSDIPGQPTLAWASFPCQDLSLAGERRGLSGTRSGTFWPFWRLLQSLERESRQVPIVVLENVLGALTSNDGSDFAALLAELEKSGYRFGALIIDGARFVAQSRPRLFLVSVLSDVAIPPKLVSPEPNSDWHSQRLIASVSSLPKRSLDSWVWWNLPAPQTPASTLNDVFEARPLDVRWHTPAETRRLIELMSPAHRERLDEAQSKREPVIGTLYKRTRPTTGGARAQRAEVRFDGVSGCLRTPSGGSSRQVIVAVDGRSVRTRLLSSREAARLMGLPDGYELPSNYNEAYHLIGDGLVVPAVRWLSRHILSPLAKSAEARQLPLNSRCA